MSEETGTDLTTTNDEVVERIQKELAEAMGGGERRKYSRFESKGSDSIEK